MFSELSLLLSLYDTRLKMNPTRKCKSNFGYLETSDSMKDGESIVEQLDPFHVSDDEIDPSYELPAPKKKCTNGEKRKPKSAVKRTRRERLERLRRISERHKRVTIVKNDKNDINSDEINPINARDMNEVRSDDHLEVEQLDSLSANFNHLFNVDDELVMAIGHSGRSGSFEIDLNESSKPCTNLVRIFFVLFTLIYVYIF